MPMEDPVLARIIQEIVHLVHPLRIILFGSAARGTAQSGSDLDLMVIVPDNADRKQALDMINRNVHRPEIPLDVLIATPAIVERHRDNPGLIYRTILATGKLVYAA